VVLLFLHVASKPQKSSTQPVYSAGLGYMPLLTAMFHLRYVFRTSVWNGMLIKTVLHYILVVPMQLSTVLIYSTEGTFT
jgi:hypothetical protein